MTTTPNVAPPPQPVPQPAPQPAPQDPIQPDPVVVQPPAEDPPPQSPPTPEEDTAIEDFAPKAPAPDPVVQESIATAATDVKSDVPQAEHDVSDFESALRDIEHGQTASLPVDAQSIEHDVTSGIATAKAQEPHFAAVLQEAKSGFHTTEFWVAAVVAILAQLQALHLPGKYGDTIATVAAVVGYIVSRGIAKAGSPNEKVINKHDLLHR